MWGWVYVSFLRWRVRPRIGEWMRWDEIERGMGMGLGVWMGMDVVIGDGVNKVLVQIGWKGA